MASLALGNRAIAPECPQCGDQIHLTLTSPERQADGTIVYDGTLARVGLMLHIRVGCKGREQ